MVTTSVAHDKDVIMLEIAWFGRCPKPVISIKSVIKNNSPREKRSRPDLSWHKRLLHSDESHTCAVLEGVLSVSDRIKSML